MVNSIFQNLRQGIALKNTVVLEGPSEIFSPSEEIPAGIKIVVDRSKDGWLFVKAPIRYSGWIKSEDIGLL